MTCYAKELGNCSNKISGEHIISEGLFDKSITVQGLHWCQNKPKTIGIKSFVANILCRNHNSLLSDYDSEAIKFFNSIKKVTTKKERFENTPTDFKISNARYNINGNLFEKWMIKTYLNVLHYSKENKLLYNKVLLLDVLFNKISLTEPYGLALMAAALGSQLKSEDRISLIPICDKEVTETNGCAMAFRGFKFLLQFPSITGKPFADKIAFSELNKEWQQLQSIYRPMEIDYKDHAKRYTDTIRFYW